MLEDTHDDSLAMCGGHGRETNIDVLARDFNLDGEEANWAVQISLFLVRITIVSF